MSVTTESHSAMEPPLSTNTAGDDDPNLANEVPGRRVTTFQLYDPKVAGSLLAGLTLSPCQLNTEVSQVVEAVDAQTTRRRDVEVYSVSSKMTCLLCQCHFTTSQQQRDHFKLDWHRFNLKQKMVGAAPISEESFENISGDVSSISGSDASSEDENDNYRDRSPFSQSGSPSRDAPSRADRRGSPGSQVVGRRHPKVFFRNGGGQLVAVQRCVLHGKKDAPSTQQELVALAGQLHAQLKWAVLMLGGGHFAGAVFDGENVVAHKTFHRYTVRAKRGTAQGMRDSQQGGNQPKSAGASLRRHNEAALAEDVQALLASWEGQLAACHRIFLRAPSYNKGALFGGRRPALDRRDPRLVTIPFATRRPTYKEVVRVHALLSAVECYGEADEAERRIAGALSLKTHKEKTNDVKCSSENAKNTSQPKQNGREMSGIDDGGSDREDVDLAMVEEEISTLELREFETNVKKPKRSKRKRKPKSKPENDVPGKAGSVEEALGNACREGDWDQLKQLVDGANDPCPTSDAPAPEPEPAGAVNRPLDGRGNTLLHVAVEAERATVLWNLMEAGADPTVKNQKGVLPYVLCKSKELRNVFRRFMAAYPDKFDYERAQIPSPLTSEKEELKAAKAAEKRRIQKKNKRMREKELKEEQKKQEEERRQREAEEEEKRQFASLSDREKRALAAERRFQAQLAQTGPAAEVAKLNNLRRCWLCGTSLVGKVPFEYLDYKFCTMQCVKEHKQQKKMAR